ncbi:MAG: hypothetical protein DRQ03_05295 [Candidatus Hydrothermota bacterium]|nr:MAG: hypothetical protein DRQ03_05295 [Candidatus Hydrothermae bacterium]
MKILLVNPPVYDFALHDFWLKPFGLLRIAAKLREQNIPFYFFDFLYKYDRRLLKIWTPKVDKYGRGKFYSVEVEKPEILSFVPRKFRRFGLPLEYLKEDVSGEHFDFVFITTGMTYWYIGVKEIIDFARKMWPRTRIVVGGVAATLMPDFYKTLGADIVVIRDDFSSLKKFGLELNIETNDFPDYSVYEKIDYVAIRLVEGCPYRCSYCASYLLKPEIRFADVRALADYIEQWYYRQGVRDFVFYDDALLVNAKKNLKLLKDLLDDKKITGKIRFHTPNALHVRYIDEKVAGLLKEMGFETIYLGVETTNPERLKETGGKLTLEEFKKAIISLKKAGFKNDQITAYLLMGLPNQPPEEVISGLEILKEYNIRVMLSEYSPIPRTPLGEGAIKEYKIKDPILTNCSVFPVMQYGIQTVNYLKNIKNEILRSLKFDA